jgi:hypothetical protein
MTEHLGWHRWWREAAIALAGSGAALLVAWVLWPAFEEWREERQAEHQRSMPVIKTTTTLLERTDDWLLIRVRGERLRGDECQFVARQAFRLPFGGDLPTPTHAEPLDFEGAPPGTLPLGPFDAGRWRLAVKNRADGGIVYALYLCKGIDARWMFAFVPRLE